MQNLKSFSRAQTLHTPLNMSFATSSAPKAKRFLKFFSRAPPLPNLQTYYDLRIYKNASYGSLFHTFFVNSLTRRKFFGLYCLKAYNISSQFLGKRITNSIFYCALADAYGVRTDLKSVRNTLPHYNDKNISVMVQYRIEAKDFSEYELEENARRYIEAIEVAGATSYKDNSVSINIGVLCNLNVLTKLNRAQTWIDQLFERGLGQFQEKLSAQTIYEKLKQRYIECDESEAAEFLSQFLNREISGDLNNVEITRQEWQQNISAYYINSPDKNENKILRQLNRLTDEDLKFVQAFCSRVRSICDQARKYKLSAVSYETEQQEFTSINNSVAQQLSTIYNSDNAFILKQLRDNGRLPEKAQTEIDLAGLSIHCFGVKVISQINSKIQESDWNREQREQSSEVFDEVVKALLEKYQNGNQILIKTSDISSIEQFKSVLMKMGLDNRKSGIKFVQNEGLGEYQTYHLMRDGYGTVKELSYGDKDQLVRWMVKNSHNAGNIISRRIENKLVINEIARRMKLL